MHSILKLAPKLLVAILSDKVHFLVGRRCWTRNFRFWAGPRAYYLVTRNALARNTFLLLLSYRYRTRKRVTRRELG